MQNLASEWTCSCLYPSEGHGGWRADVDFLEVSMAEVLVPLSFFAFLAAIILVPGYLKSKDRGRMHETLRIAYEKGQPVPPELIQAIQSGDEVGKNANRSEKDLRSAVILIGLSLGLVAMSFALGQTEGAEAQFGTLAGATIPGFIGLGFLVLWYFNRDKPKV
jgi:hypothetical protein